MSTHLLQLNSAIKSEADNVLCGKGLLDILKSYGQPHVSGSYELGLMTWKDLDIYIESDNIKENIFFELGSRICTTYHPVKMSYRNELTGKTEGLPHGLYWGVYLENNGEKDWKVDIWMVSSAECKRMLDYVAVIKNKLTPESVNDILAIKSKCCQDPMYRRTITSSDIYSAVLDHHVKNYKDFMDYMHKKIFSNK